jgi:hypothetical protein
VEGNVTKRKMRTEEAGKKQATETSNKPLIIKNGG